ncbi:MAG: exosortase F system-associated protein [Flavobacteriaceae bacterium]
MNNSIRIILVVLLFILLILVRAFANDLFYDPFIDYFKNDYLHSELPQFDALKLGLNIFFRYILNTVISLGIIFLIFKNRQFLNFSLKFYLVLFLILVVLLFIIIKFNITTSYLPLFYVRRFLIHPIFVIILIPAFYYQNGMISKEK